MLLKSTDKIKISQATNKHYIEMDNGGVADLSYPTSSTRRGRVQSGGGISPTITSSNNELHKIDRGEIREDMTREEMIGMYKIRKLTEKECGKLQGVKEEDIDAMRSVCSKSACYRLYGNSICVPVLMGIFSQLNIQNIPTWNECIEKRSKNDKKSNIR